MLGCMIEVLLDAPLPTPLDPDFFSDAEAALIAEHRYWTCGEREVTLVGDDGRQHHLSRYCANWTQPRPESFKYAPVLLYGNEC